MPRGRRRLGAYPAALYIGSVPGGVTLGPYEPRVVHLIPMVSVATIVARILLESILFPLAVVSSGMATSPLLTLWLLRYECPALDVLLLLMLLLPFARRPIFKRHPPVSRPSGVRA